MADRELTVSRLEVAFRPVGGDVSINIAEFARSVALGVNPASLIAGW